MQEIKIDRDIRLWCVTAISFPMGIGEAFRLLEQKLGKHGRMFYGVSRPERNTIIYKAAAEAKEDEQGVDCEEFVVKQGTYLSMYIKDWRQDESSIGKTFQSILQDTRLDPEGACIEQYLNDKDVICMVRLADNYFIK